MSVRTKVLVTQALIAGSQTVYTCPAGKTAIVKTISLSRSSAGAVTVTTLLVRALAGRGAYLTSLSIAAPIQTIQTYLVLGPGDQLRFTLDTGTGDCWVSGVELVGVA